MKWAYVILSFLVLLSVVDAEMSHLEESVAASEDPMILEAYEGIDTIGVDLSLLLTSEKPLQDMIDGAKPGKIVKIPSGHYTLNNTLHIDKDLTLIGEGAVVIDAHKKCKLLHIEDPKLTVTIENIAFVNGKGDYGSAINNAAKSLTLKGCIFSNNVADEVAIIRNGKGNLNIVDSEICDNMAFDSIVVCEKGKLKFENVRFHNNTAFRLNNGINISGTENKLDSELVIKNSNFSNNCGCVTWGKRGGYSIWNVCAAYANVSIEGSEFGSNIFDRGNGVVALGDCFSVVKNCRMHHNKADQIGHGLGLTIEGGKALLENCEILENQIPDELDWSPFDDTIQGSGVQTSYDAKVIMKDCIIRGNVGMHAAGIHNKNKAILTLDNTTVSDNIATIKGGGVINEGTLIIKNSTFSGNQASIGGAILNTESGKVVVSGRTTFIGNKALDGGAIFNEGGVVKLEGRPRFLDNDASDPDDKGQHGKGGAIYTAGPIQIENALFANNKAVSGSAIWSEGNLTDTGSLYYMNEALASGTILLNQSIKNYRLSMTLNDTTFLRNTAGQNAGAIWNGGKLTINGGRFVDNSALNGVGGSISCSPLPKAPLNPELYICETEMARNYASIDGGAIYCYDTITTIEKSKKEKGGTTEIHGNIAENNGGGIWIDSPKRLIVERGEEWCNDYAATIHDNLAKKGKGGGFYTGKEAHNGLGIKMRCNEPYDTWPPCPGG